MLPPAHRETLFSYLSRLAASKGVTTPNLCYDLGAGFRRFLDQDRDALDRLMAWTRMTQADMAELLSWTGQPLGMVRMRFRGEVFVSRALRNPAIRGCPDCLRGDAATRPEAPLEAMWLRGDWQLRVVSICVRHRRPLSTLWTVQAPWPRNDIGARLQEISEALRAGQFDLPVEDPNAYDLWLDRCLDEGAGEAVLGAYGLYAATTLCRLLGDALLRLGEVSEQDPRKRLRMAQAAGFEVISKGDEAVRSALDQIAATAPGALAEPRRAFGALYNDMNQAYRGEEAFSHFRHILRDCILDIWPIAAGEVVLGEVVLTRRLHSVRTAARQAGIREPLMREFLLEAGAINKDDPRPDSRTTFDATRHEALLAEIPQLVGQLAMCKAMGATQGELQALEQHGILTPRTRVPTTKARWWIADGLALVAELERLVTTDTTTDPGWERIQVAPTRRGVPVGDVISAIRSGTIRVRKRQGQFGYSSFEVLKGEIVPLRVERATESTIPAGSISVAAFGRSIGIRDGAHFIAFAKAGHAGSFSHLNPRTRREQACMTAEDVAAFHRTWVTVSLIAAEFGLPFQTVRAILRKRGIKPFSPDGADYGNIYLRHEVEPLLPLPNA